MFCNFSVYLFCYWCIKILKFCINIFIYIFFIFQYFVTMWVLSAGRPQRGLHLHVVKMSYIFSNSVLLRYFAYFAFIFYLLLPWPYMVAGSRQTSAPRAGAPHIQWVWVWVPLKKTARFGIKIVARRARILISNFRRHMFRLIAAFRIYRRR